MWQLACVFFLQGLIFFVCLSKKANPVEVYKGQDHMYAYRWPNRPGDFILGLIQNGGKNITFSYAKLSKHMEPYQTEQCVIGDLTKLSPTTVHRGPASKKPRVFLFFTFNW